MITCLLCAIKQAENCQLCLEYQTTLVLKKKRTLLKSICGIKVWILPNNLYLYSRKANSKINHIHERTLTIMYKDKDNISSAEKLLKKDKYFCIHHRSIQQLAIQFFKGAL